MPETISFSKQKQNNNQVAIDIKTAPAIATLKYCANDNLPSEEEKDVAIYTTDKHRLYHGNGKGAPLSPITNDTYVTKDLIFVAYDLQVGVTNPEIPFPYYGRMKKILIIPASGCTITERFTVELQILRAGTWTPVKEITLSTGDTSAEVILDIPIDNETLRFFVKEVQKDLNNVVSVVKIDI